MTFNIPHGVFVNIYAKIVFSIAGCPSSRLCQSGWCRPSGWSEDRCPVMYYSFDNDAELTGNGAQVVHDDEVSTI